MLIEVKADVINHVTLRTEAESYVEAYDIPRKYLYETENANDVLIVGAKKVKEEG